MHNVWEYTAKKQGFRHPATKQPFVVEGALKSAANEQSVVLDPFLGSGTTCFVAQALGIKSIGIEIDSAYCEIARDRIQGKYGEFESTFPQAK